MIVVTGANGRYGRQAVLHLLDRVPADSLAVSVRDPARAAELAELGVDVRRGDFDDPATLASAFAGAEKVLMVSTDRLFGDRVTQHRNAVDATRQASVQHLFYTSAPHAEASKRRSPGEHLATEQHIRESEGQERRLKELLEGMGEGTSTVKETVTRLAGNVQALVGALFTDEPLKNAIAAYAFEHFEAASYCSLKAAAEALGEQEIARTCDSIMRQELAMADWVFDQLSPLTQKYLQREAAGVEAKM